MASDKAFIALCSMALFTQLLVPAHSRSCCLRYTKKHLPCKRLLAYSLQSMNGNCDINAVIFHQTNGRLVCADPLSVKTQRGINCINQRRQQEEKVMMQKDS